MPTPRKLNPPKSSAYASNHRNWNRNVATSDAQSIPFQPGRIRRSGFTTQSVSATTAWPMGLRNGARISLHHEAQQQRIREEPEHNVEQILDCLVGHGRGSIPG